MKVQKGNAGYIRERKKRTLLKVILEFGIVLALLILGIVQTGERMNVLTIVAVLGCLPASKALVEFIMILPHHSVAEEMAKEIQEKAGQMLTIYDMVFTSEKQIMPVESIVVSGDRVCGFASNVKIDSTFIEKHINQYLSANGYTGVSTKIYHNYSDFLIKTEEMSRVAGNETIGQAIRGVLLSISL